MFFIFVDGIVLVVVGVILGWLDELLFVDGFLMEELNWIDGLVIYRCLVFDIFCVDFFMDFVLGILVDEGIRFLYDVVCFCCEYVVFVLFFVVFSCLIVVLVEFDGIFEIFLFVDNIEVMNVVDDICWLFFDFGNILVENEVWGLVLIGGLVEVVDFEGGLFVDIVCGLNFVVFLGEFEKLVVLVKDG